MLTTGRRSRLRLTLGGTAVAALMVAGLVGTASGTAAAATVRAGVEKATGIDIAAIDTKLAANLQSAPAAPPPAPEGADAPLLPPPGAQPPAPGQPAPPAPGQRVKTIKIIKLDKDGNTISEDVRNVPEMGDMGPMGPMGPMKISARNCDMDGKKDGPVVLTAQSMKMTEDKDDKGKPRVMIICNDRIERMVRIRRPDMPPPPPGAPGAPGAPRMGIYYGWGPGDGKNVERQAYTHALMGLRAARERIASDPNMTGDAKKSALDGIDQSIRELEANLAKAK